MWKPKMYHPLLGWLIGVRMKNTRYSPLHSLSEYYQLIHLQITALAWIIIIHLIEVNQYTYNIAAGLSNYMYLIQYFLPRIHISHCPETSDSPCTSAGDRWGIGSTRCFSVDRGNNNGHGSVHMYVPVCHVCTHLFQRTLASEIWICDLETLIATLSYYLLIRQWKQVFAY